MNKEILENFSEKHFETLKNWVNGLNINGSTPRGQKKNKDRLTFIRDQIKMSEMFGSSELCINNIAATLSHLTMEDITTINLKFSNNEKGVFKTKNLEIINRSSMAENSFKDFSIEISKMINGLSGFHRHAALDGLKIVIVSKTEQKSPGCYKSELDEIWLRPNLKVDNELYGHAKFIVMHELGHRYDYKYGKPKDFEDYLFYTTNYSRTPVDFGASETFAEIFAISKNEWREKYSEFSEPINRFCTAMIEHTKEIKPKRRVPSINSTLSF